MGLNVLKGVAVSNNRKYGRGLQFVEEGFAECWSNADTLIHASELLLTGGFHAPSLSLSVLALEEMGKLFLIDGLLFAKQDDQKSEVFQKGQRSHNIKLAAIPMISAVTVHVASADPRFKFEREFKIALSIAHETWKASAQSVLNMAGEADFQFLDGWKQKGFYVSLVNGNSFRSPESVIDRSAAQSVFAFAKLSKGNLNFALSDGNLRRYIDRAWTIRSKLSESDHATLEEAATVICDQLFEGIDGEASQSRNS